MIRQIIVTVKDNASDYDVEHLVDVIAILTNAYNLDASVEYREEEIEDAEVG